MARDTLRARVVAARASYRQLDEARVREQRKLDKALAKWGTVPQQIMRAEQAKRVAEESAAHLAAHRAEVDAYVAGVEPPAASPGEFTKLLEILKS